MKIEMLCAMAEDWQCGCIQEWRALSQDKERQSSSVYSDTLAFVCVCAPVTWLPSAGSSSCDKQPRSIARLMSYTEVNLSRRLGRLQFSGSSPVSFRRHPRE